MGIKHSVCGKAMQEAGCTVQDNLCDGRFSDPPECKTGNGDAKLDSRQKLVDGVFELEGGACTGAAQCDELLDTCLADTDQGELRSNEEACGQNKKGHHD